MSTHRPGKSYSRTNPNDFLPTRSLILFYEKANDARIIMSAKDTAKLSDKFQICIPKSVRTVRHWKAGQEFAFIPKGEGVLLVPVPKIEDLGGVARGAKPEDYRDRTDRF